MCHLGVIAAMLCAGLGNMPVTDDVRSIQVGDPVTLILTGDLSTVFRPSREAHIQNIDRRPMFVTATVIARSGRSKIKVLARSIVERRGDKDQMVTLTANIDLSKVCVTSASGVSTVAALRGLEPPAVLNQSKAFSVQLSDRNAVSLETRELAY